MALQDEHWTPEQRQAATTADRSVLVGAAAGSGKTAVLARRCAYLVAEAPMAARCDVENLLVVTFTEAAASEMRVRVGRAIRDRLAARPTDARLRYQLAALDGAAISTIHAFCRRVLNQWFAAAGLDPEFDLLDPDEQLLLKRDAAERVFAELYQDAGESGQRFRRYVDLYGVGSDQIVGDQVLWLADYLESIVDPHAWLAQARTWLAPPPDDSLPVELAQSVRHKLQQELSWQHRESLRAARTVRSRYPAEAYVADILEGHATELQGWKTLAASPTWSDLNTLTSAILQYKFPAKRGGPRLAPDAVAERADRDLADQWHKHLKKVFAGRLQNRWCRFTVAEMVEGLRRVLPEVETLVDLADRFAAEYRHLKELDGRLDFADLERKTLDLLRENGGDNEAVRSHRRRFRYVCVDEFQDVNPVQEAILRLVSGEPDPDRPDNLFCVGDVKQSIYRFRLAEPGIFVARQERFRSAEVAGSFIALGRNFRSRKGIIDGVNAVFERLMTAETGPILYDDDARLWPGLEYPNLTNRTAAVELHLLDRDFTPRDDADEAADEDSGQDPAEWAAIEREAFCVGRRIRQFMGMEDGFERASVCVKGSEPGEGMRTEPMDFRHIVILLRSRLHKAEPMVEVLGRMGIPVHAELATGYFESTEVRDILSLLNLLDNRQQSIPLAAVMRSPLFAPAFDDSDLARVRSIDRGVPFHEAFGLYRHKGSDAFLAERCGSLARLLERYQTSVRRRPLAEALWQIYSETGCLAYVAGLPGGRQRRANLIKLHERARQFGTFARQGLFRFIRFMQQIEESGRDLGAALPASESDNVVRIMSIHSSKGLEFPVVVLPDLAKSFNFQDARGRLVVSRDRFIGPKVIDDELSIEYPTVAHTLAVDDAEAQTRAEEMRVLYVAMTRAREKLILVGTSKVSGGDAAQVGAEWAGHDGALPPLTASTAHCYLDWLIPAMGCQRASTNAAWPEWLAVEVHDGETIRAWDVPSELAAGDRKERARLAELPSLPKGEPVAKDDPLIDLTLRRLRESYGQDDLTAVPAAMAVTELKRRHDATRELDEQTRELALAWPSPSAAAVAGSRGEPVSDPATASPELAADRGIVTHLVLQHIDLPSATDPDKLDDEIAKLEARGILEEGQAELIDRDAMRWFFGTSLGRELRQAGEGLRREVMFVSRVPPEAFDQAVHGADHGDVILVRGVIDVLLVGDDDCTVIDYKTARVDTDGVPARAEHYRSQLDLYAQAAHELTGRPVRRRVLVFLGPRRIHEFDGGSVDPSIGR